MRRGLRVGRLFGIDIRIDWSWLLIAFLITWNLGAAFGNLHPDWSVALTWSTAVIAALLFFASVLAHELAHSVMARAQGVPVRSITLFLFGGVSDIQREPPSPRAEFLITIVGPITSFVIGGLLLWIAGVSIGPLDDVEQAEATMRGLSPLTTMVLWLGSINVILGTFNLIPGFPLDGGRILRSILWAITDSLHRATRWASWAGQGIAWLMILGGIAMAFGVRIPFFGTGLINGIWLVFIGWFLNSAAIQSYQRLVIQDLLEGVPVSRIMRSDPPTASADMTISQLVDHHVMKSDDSNFPILDGERLTGLITLDDIRSVPRSKWDETRVKDIMTTSDKLVTVAPDEEASDALQKLTEQDVRQLPVVRNGHLEGLLRRRDIVRWLQLQSDELDT